jgi:DNA polymerase III alpha subunit
LPVLVQNQVGYRNLCRLITVAKLRGTKQHAPVQWSDLEGTTDGMIALTGDEEGAVRRLIEADKLEQAKAYTERLKNAFGDRNVCVEVQRHLRRGEDLLNDRLFALASDETAGCGNEWGALCDGRRSPSPGCFHLCPGRATTGETSGFRNLRERQLI